MKQTVLCACALLALLSCDAWKEDEHVGLFPVKVNGKWGYMDKAGEVAIDTQFAEARDFVEGLALIRKDGKYDYIEATGKLVTDLQFESCGDCFYSAPRYFMWVSRSRACRQSGRSS